MSKQKTLVMETEPAKEKPNPFQAATPARRREPRPPHAAGDAKQKTQGWLFPPSFRPVSLRLLLMEQTVGFAVRSIKTACKCIELRVYAWFKRQLWLACWHRP